MFHAVANGGNGSTEYEYLNLVNALVLATKPSHCLETGTAEGYGSFAIASALAFNQNGHLTTIDNDQCQKARDYAQVSGLHQYITFARTYSTRHLANYPGPAYDFAFFDSALHDRAREMDICEIRKKLAPGALCVFHDTSRVRVEGNFEFTEFLKKYGGIEFYLSRGLRIIQTPGTPFA